jgi:hypothetical protein
MATKTLRRATPARGARSAAPSSAPAPIAEESPERVLQSLKSTSERGHAIASGHRELAAGDISEARRIAQRYADKLRARLHDSLSSVPDAVRSGPCFVATGDSVAAKNAAAIRRGIGRLNQSLGQSSRPAITGVLSLSDEDFTLLRKKAARIDGDHIELPAEEVEPLLFRAAGSDRPAFLAREDPLATCQVISQEHALTAASLGIDGEGGLLSTPGSTAPVTPEDVVHPARIEDVPTYVANLMDFVAPPEAGLRLHVAARSNQEAVDATVDALQLKRGPADVPAYYDFHQLQIAFDDVWQECFDGGLLDLGERLYREIVLLGGEPDAAVAAAPGALQRFLSEARQTAQAHLSDTPTEVIQAFGVSPDEWTALDADQRSKLITLAMKVNELEQRVPRRDQERWYRSYIAALRKMGCRLKAYAQGKVREKSDPLSRLHTLLASLDARAKQLPAFTIFAATPRERSVNFGLLATYRQKWSPLNYQAGALVRTITLTPKEVRKYSIKTTRKKSRAEREVENNLRTRKEESSDTSRAETEIVQKAMTKTNFSLAAQGGFNTKVWNASARTAWDRSAESSSAEAKKDFREAIFKASDEYKREYTLEVKTDEAEETEVTETYEISNPNDELPVTFLFYELQRRYRISERIYRVTPVVLVAQEVPAPDEIDDDWLVAHDWVLRRTILDDSFVPALTYLSTKLVGDEKALQDLALTRQQQYDLVRKLGNEVLLYHRQTGQRYASLEDSIRQRIQLTASDESDSWFGSLREGLWGGDEPTDAARLVEEAAKDAYERAEKAEKDARNRLQREVTALQAATEQYAKALSEHLNRKAQVLRLRVHVKENILYYMQAIWSHEPPDQRFFRLYHTRVPDLRGTRTYSIETTPSARASMPHVAEAGGRRFTTTVKLDEKLQFTTLVECADLDNLLGFKGNYMIFPLKTSNALTDAMMAPYADSIVGVRDPDEAGNWTPDEFGRYVNCLKKKLSSAEFERIAGRLKEQYLEILSAPRRAEEDITVPSGSVFVEALPGAHPLLEDFKLAHRILDVKKVQAEVRKAELENVRATARLLAGEREDPDIEKKIVVEEGLPVMVGDQG